MLTEKKGGTNPGPSYLEGTLPRSLLTFQLQHIQSLKVWSLQNLSTPQGGPLGG